MSCLFGECLETTEFCDTYLLYFGTHNFVAEHICNFEDFRTIFAKFQGAPHVDHHVSKPQTQDGYRGIYVDQTPLGGVPYDDPDSSGGDDWETDEFSDIGHRRRANQYMVRGHVMDWWLHLVSVSICSSLRSVLTIRSLHLVRTQSGMDFVKSRCGFK